MLRIAVAFFLSPLAAVSVVFVALALGAGIAGWITGEVTLFEPFNLSALKAVFFVGAPVAWLVALIAGVPALLLHRGSGALSRAMVTRVATIAGGVALAVFGVFVAGDAQFLGLVVAFPVGLAAGALAGRVFWQIGCTERPSH